MYKQREKKEASGRWLRVGRENSNNELQKVLALPVALYGFEADIV